MKRFVVTAILLFGSYVFAAPAQLTILGEWNLTGRTCSSETPTNDGIKIGTDKIGVLFNSDNSYAFKMNVAGCQTDVNGTYAVTGKKITFTSATSQSCKETSPQPMVETYSMYIAYLSDSETVLIATGEKASMACPSGDALILKYEKVPPSTDNI